MNLLYELEELVNEPDFDTNPVKQAKAKILRKEVYSGQSKNGRGLPITEILFYRLHHIKHLDDKGFVKRPYTGGKSKRVVVTVEGETYTFNSITSFCEYANIYNPQFKQWYRQQMADGKVTFDDITIKII